MKKYLSIFLVLILTLNIFVGILPASALTVSQFESMKNTTWRADYFYGGMTRDYIINVITNELWDTYAADQYANTAIAPATEFEEVYNKYFVVETSMLEAIRSYLSYDAVAGTYTLNYPGGFGGMLPDREYAGYKSLGNDRYALYYQHITYDILSDSIASQYPEYETWDPITHEGQTYECGPDGYYRIASYDNYGKIHTVELNGDVVRFVSSTEYTNGDSLSFDKEPSLDQIIKEKTSISDYAATLGDTYECAVYNGDTVVSSDSLIGTGMTIVITNKDTSETYTKEVVILGDVTGDGIVKAGDYMRVKRSILDPELLTGVYFEAGDVNGDGIMKANDYMRIKRYMAGNYDIYE